jgi:hypothetical protein
MFTWFMLCVQIATHPFGAIQQCPFGGWEGDHFIEAPIRSWENDDYVESWLSKACGGRHCLQHDKVPKPRNRPQNETSPRHDHQSELGRGHSHRHISRRGTRRNRVQVVRRPVDQRCQIPSWWPLDNCRRLDNARRHQKDKVEATTHEPSTMVRAQSAEGNRQAVRLHDHGRRPDIAHRIVLGCSGNILVPEG